MTFELIFTQGSSPSTPDICVDKNLTYYVSSEVERVSVQISPDISQELPVGRFRYKVSICVVFVDVINNGERFITHDA